MVVVKLPQDPDGLATVEYWNQAEGAPCQAKVRLAALEKPEEQLRRLLRMEEITAAMGGPVVRVTDATLVITFDSAEDRDRFIKEKFQDSEEIYNAVVH